MPVDDRWRVEDLARASDVSVDTIRFYQKRRLLDPPEREGRVAWYGPEHLERLAQIRELQRSGLSLALIGRMVRGEMDATDAPLAAAVVAASGDDGAPEVEEFLTLDELADRTGVALPLLESIVSDGLLVPRARDGGAQFTASDAAIIAAGLELLGAGLPMPELLALARHHHSVTREIAERAVAMFDEHVRTPLRDADLPEEEKADRLVEAFRVLLPAITALVTHHFRRVLLAVAQEHLEKVGDATEVAAVQAEGGRRIEAVRSR